MRSVTVLSPSRTRKVTTLNPVTTLVGQVKQERSQVRRVVTIGIPGPSGNNPFLNTNNGFDYIQSTVSGVWTIVHNLGFKPNVQAFTVGGVKVNAYIVHLSLNVAEIRLSPSMAGYARLS
jgi:hypothetical protein